MSTNLIKELKSLDVTNEEEKKAVQTILDFVDDNEPIDNQISFYTINYHQISIFDLLKEQ